MAEAAEQVQVPGAPAQPEATPTSCSGTIRLRGLPFAAGEQEVREFFKGYDLKTVFICKRNGRSTGEAYVQLDAPAGLQVLQTLNKQHMGHRYIELFDASEADLATAKTLCVDRMKGFVVRLRGIPFNATASDVLKFFEGVDVVRGIEGVVFTYTPDGRPTGEAFVEVQDEEAQKEAMKHHKELIGTRYIELFTATKADLIQAIQHNRLILGYANRKRYPGGGPIPNPGMYGNMHHNNHQRGPPHMRGHQGMQYMRGVDDVTNMFQGVNITQPSGQMMPHQQHQGQQHGGPGFQGGMQQPRFRPQQAGRYGNADNAAGQVRRPQMQGVRPMMPGGRGFQGVPNHNQGIQQVMTYPGNGQQAVLVQQPQYIIQQPQNVQYPEAAFTPVANYGQEQYFGQQPQQITGVMRLGKPTSGSLPSQAISAQAQYVSSGAPTYTLTYMPQGDVMLAQSAAGDQGGMDGSTTLVLQQ